MFDWSDETVPADELGRVHFVGIGGAGMSAIARVMLGRGIPVSGSDAKDVPVLAALRAMGGAVGVGFDADRLAAADTVVVGSAIRGDNVEVVAARAQGQRVIHRSQALQGVMAGRTGVAVAGTNGKTTTSSLLTAALLHCGEAPGFAIGGELVEPPTNGAHGSGEVFVAEACESDGSFVVYRPQVSVITNVQPDHLDYYGTAENVEKAFGEFAACLPADGLLVACADDEGSARVAADRRAAGLPVTTYGFAADADVRISEFVQGADRSTFRIAGPADDAQQVELGVPGEHNAANATAAFVVLRSLGVGASDAVAGLGSFAGTRRRFERKGTAGGVTVYDDYGHNPAKVAAAVATGRTVAAQGRLIAVFQPHLFSRTRDFADEFGEALSAADDVIVMDVYPAREEPIDGVSGKLVDDAVSLPAERHAYCPTAEEAVAEAAKRARAGDVVLTVGAGDVTALGPDILARCGLASPEGT